MKCRLIAVVLVGLLSGLGCGGGGGGGGTTSPTPATLPAAPTNVQATPLSATSVRVIWTDTSSNESNFVIERATGTGAFAMAGTVNANIASFDDTGLTASTQYVYRVKAVNSAGSSPSATQTTATTQAAPVTAAAAPTNLAATANSSSKIDLAWTDNATNEDGVKIERKTGSGTFSQITTVAANTIAYSDTGLMASTAYTYRIRAYNTAGDSTYSNESTVTTPAVGSVISHWNVATAASTGAVTTRGTTVFTSGGSTFAIREVPPLAVLDGNGNVHLVWLQEITSTSSNYYDYDVYHSVVTATGPSAATLVSGSEPADGSFLAASALGNSGKIAVSWGRDGTGVLVANIVDGTSPGVPSLVSSGDVYSATGNPNIIRSVRDGNGNVHLVWLQEITSTSSNYYDYDVYHSLVTATGPSIPTLVSGSEPANSGFLAVAALGSSGKLVVGWGRDGTGILVANTSQ